ncbi:MAG: hypothetical protein ABIL62_11115 [Planctomycetota bacterium]
MPRTRAALIARLAHLEKYRQKHGVKVVGEHIIGRMDGNLFKSIRGAWRGLCKDHSFENLLTTITDTPIAPICCFPAVPLCRRVFSSGIRICA